MNSGLQIYNEQNNWHSAGSELRIQSQARIVIYTTGIYAYFISEVCADTGLARSGSSL